MKIPDFSKCRILVIGDIMLDRYWTGATSRISPEAPVPIVKISDTQNRLGGAANVAANLSQLGCQTSIFGIIGDDKAGKIVRELLDTANIQHNLHIDSQNPTVTKLRVMSQHQQLIRLDFEEHLLEVDKNLVLAEIENEIGTFDALIISDYAKGTIRDARYLIELCNKNNVPVLVDPKGVDFGRYSGATLLTPNRNELEAVVGKHQDMESLFAAAQQLCCELNIKAIIITLSDKGMALIQPDKKTVQLPAQAKDVYDVTGAGDTVISTLTAAIASKLNLDDAMRLANVAAGIVVGKSGTAAVSHAELAAALNPSKTRSSDKILDINDLLEHVAKARAQGQKIVFTNGCFDLLHLGHTRYLQEAAELGDKLIVAVNSDASVKRLKGSERPVNTLTARTEVLAALGCVDWVVSFEDDTPLNLIEKILPDVLVKGGDYKIEDIVGYNIVKDTHGTVITLPYHDNYSTTSIISKTKNNLSR